MLKFAGGIAIVTTIVLLLLLSADGRVVRAQAVKDPGGQSAGGEEMGGGRLEEAVEFERLSELLGPVPVPPKPYRIAAVLNFFGDQYWQIMAAGMQSRANARGVDLDVRAASRAIEPFGQLAIAEEMLSRGCDLLIAAPVTEINLKPALEKTKETGTPVVGIDDAFAKHRVSVDPYRTGAIAAAYFKEKLPAGGRIAIVRGLAGAHIVRRRAAGFMDALGNSGISVVANVYADWDLQRAMDAAACILREHPEIKGFYCMNDVMALGVVEAVRSRGYSGKVLVVGTDGIGQAYQSIRAGEMSATIDTYPHKIGEAAIDVALRLLAGQNVPGEVTGPQKLITSENVLSPPSW